MTEPDPAPPEETAEGTVEETADEPAQRRYPSTIGGAFYLMVLAATAVGIVIAYGGNWRLGVRCLAGGLCFAALLRIVLPRKDAGMLAVRSRVLDAIVLGGVGAALFFLATTIPNQPG